MKISTLCALLMAAAVHAPTLAATLPYPICPTEVEQQMIDLINDIRTDSGLTVLEVDRRLILSSRRHSNDMGLHEFVSHVGSDGSTYLQRAEDEGYYSACGETIGAGFTSAAAVVAAWMSSDLQRANLLRSAARHIGTGYAQYQNSYQHFYTAVFGCANEAAVPPDCGCCLGRVGDANGAGGDEPTIGDVSVMIDALFISGDPGVIACLAEADVNRSGGANPTGDDVTIGDISILIDYLFITGSSLGLPDCM